MKSPIHFILLVILCTNYFLSTSSQSSNNVLVLDGNKNPVEVGSTYYIRPAKKDDVRGGVSLAPTGAQRCALTVIQEKVAIQNGIPVNFHPSDPQAKFVSVSSGINIKFDTHLRCANSTMWRIGKQYVEVNGTLGDANGDTAKSRFKIEDGSGDSYKIVFSVLDVDFNIGVTVSKGGLRPLILTTADTYEVKFWKHN